MPKVIGTKTTIQATGKIILCSFVFVLEDVFSTSLLLAAIDCSFFYSELLIKYFLFTGRISRLRINPPTKSIAKILKLEL